MLGNAMQAGQAELGQKLPCPALSYGTVWAKEPHLVLHFGGAGLLIGKLALQGT